MGRYALILAIVLLTVSFVQADYNITGTRSCEEFTTSCDSYVNDGITSIALNNTSYAIDNQDIIYVNDPVYTENGDFPTIKDCKVEYGQSVAGSTVFQTGSNTNHSLYSYEIVNTQNDTCVNDSINIDTKCGNLDFILEFNADLYQFSGGGCNGSVTVYSEDICSQGTSTVSSSGDSFIFARQGYKLIEEVSAGEQVTNFRTNKSIPCDGKQYFNRIEQSATPTGANYEQYLVSTADYCNSQEQTCVSYSEPENDSLENGFGCADDETLVNRTCSDFSCNATCVGTATIPLLASEVVDRPDFSSISTNCFDNVGGDDFGDTVTDSLGCIKDEVLLPFFTQVLIKVIIFILVIGVAYIFADAMIGMGKNLKR